MSEKTAPYPFRKMGDVTVYNLKDIDPIFYKELLNAAAQNRIPVISKMRRAKYSELIQCDVNTLALVNYKPRNLTPSKDKEKKGFYFEIGDVYCKQISKKAANWDKPNQQQHRITQMPADFKEKAIDYINRGFVGGDIASELGISPDTALRWIKNVKLWEFYQSKTGKGRMRYDIDQLGIDGLKLLLIENNFNITKVTNRLGYYSAVINSYLREKYNTELDVLKEEVLTDAIKFDFGQLTAEQMAEKYDWRIDTVGKKLLNLRLIDQNEYARLVKISDSQRAKKSYYDKKTTLKDSISLRSEEMREEFECLSGQCNKKPSN